MNHDLVSEKGNRQSLIEKWCVRLAVLRRTLAITNASSKNSQGLKGMPSTLHKLRFALCLSLVVWSYSSYAQNLNLVCRGSKESVGRGAKSTEETSDSYAFENGKLYGVWSAKWSQNTIIVEIPLQAGERSIEKYKRVIMFDRNVGSVYDQTQVWALNSNTRDGLPDLILEFEGNCVISSERKF